MLKGRSLIKGTAILLVEPNSLLALSMSGRIYVLDREGL